MFSRKSDELPEWSVKKQKYYRFSRILWKANYNSSYSFCCYSGLYATPLMLNFLLKLLVLSWRVRFENPVPNSVVIGLWHQDLPACLAAFKRRNIAVLISKSRDGSKFAKLANSLGYDVFRGSSSNGQSCVRHLLKALKANRSAGMALDGPKGPALVAKPGAEWLAKKAEVQQVNISVKYSCALRLNSWDKTYIPLPFSKVEVSYSL